MVGNLAQLILADEVVNVPEGFATTQLLRFHDDEVWRHTAIRFNHFGRRR